MKKLVLLLMLALICYPVQSQKVKKLLAQGKIEKAIAYAEKQKGPKKSDCFFTIATYYSDRGDYSMAEDHFNTSGKVKEGYVKIAESIMRGEVIDTVLVIDIKKVKTYLEKVYDTENDVFSKMAGCFEEYGIDKKGKFEYVKSLKKLRIAYMSGGGKTINVEKAFIIFKKEAEIYFDEAIRFYEKLGNIEKMEELKKEMEVLNQELSKDK